VAQSAAAAVALPAAGDLGPVVVTEGARALERAAAISREAAHAAMRETRLAPDFTALVLGIAAWAEGSRRDPAALGDATLGHRLRAVAPDLLGRLAHSARRPGRHIGRLDDAELHRVRKSLGVLRYAADDLRSIYRGKAVGSFAKGCKVVQDQLGTINDAATAGVLAAGLAAEPGEVGSALGVPDEWLQAGSAAAKDGLVGAWRDFTDAREFWR
jgi:triphosphatase